MCSISHTTKIYKTNLGLVNSYYLYILLRGREGKKKQWIVCMCVYTQPIITVILT